MVWSLLKGKNEATILLPFRLTHETMHPFIDQVLDDDGEPRYDSVRFDLARLDFVDPTGVVVFSNLVDFLKDQRVKVRVKVAKPFTRAVEYLDDFGFFRHYQGSPLREGASIRNTTVPLEHVKSERIF